MSFKTDLMGTGTPAAQATAIIGSVTSGLTALGSTQGTALGLTSSFNQFSSVPASTGAILPSFMQPGDTLCVSNNGANALLVYPPTGAQIGAGATNAGFSVAAGKTACFTMVTPTIFGAMLSA